MRLSPASVVHFSASVRYFLCLIFMGTNILLDEIPSSFVLDVLQTNAASTIKGVKLEVSGKLNLSINLKPSR